MDGGGGYRRAAHGYRVLVEPVSRTPTHPSHYAALSAGYGALMGALLAASRDREPPDRGDLPVLGLATFALAKLVTKEKVETWVREPFLEEAPDGERRPKGDGLRYAVGELLSCSRCMGAWSALGLVGLHTLRPREGRIVASVLAISAANDWLQSGFTRLCAKTDAAQQEAEAPDAGERRFVRVSD